MDKRNVIERIYNLYEQKMYIIAYSILGDVGDAEDAVQDAFEKLIRAVRKVSDPESEKTKNYVIKVIRNASIDRYRKKKNRWEHESATEPELFQAAKASCEDDIADRDALQARLSILEESQREVVELHVIEGMPLSAIAEKAGLSLPAVRKRYERGMRRLREAEKGGI